MKKQLVKICTLTCLLLGAMSVQAEVDKRVWEETSKSDMTSFVTAVKNAGYIDDEGKILRSGIGYAGQYAIGPELVKQIVPAPYLSNEDLGRLLFILNGLYNADGSVRQFVTIDEFVVIGQGVGWFVPVEVSLFQRLVTLDQALIEINSRAKSGQMVSSEIDNITQYLFKLTGRNLADQINPAQIAHMNDRIHRVEDGQWTLAMRKAARNEAVVATTPAIKKLEVTISELTNKNTALDQRLHQTEKALLAQSATLETTVSNVATASAERRSIEAKMKTGLSDIETSVGEKISESVGMSQSQSRFRDYILAGFGVLFLCWLMVITWKKGKAPKSEAVRPTSIGDKVKEREGESADQVFDVMAHLREAQKLKKAS